MKLEQHRTVFFVFVAGLAWADLIGIIVNTVPVLIVYMRGHFVGGVSALSSPLDRSCSKPLNGVKKHGTRLIFFWGKNYLFIT